jgi:hypothetical protein
LWLVQSLVLDDVGQFSEEVMFVLLGFKGDEDERAEMVERICAIVDHIVDLLEV